MDLKNYIDMIVKNSDKVTIMKFDFYIVPKLFLEDKNLLNTIQSSAEEKR